MRQTWALPVVLENSIVRLEPLAVSHAPGLAEAAGSLETFAYFSRGPDRLDAEGMGAFVEFLLGPAETVAFCVMVGGAPMGITTYLDIKAAHRGLEIGWTWYSPSVRGTKVNPACKLLLLGHAFETLRAIRVCLKTDERNARSRAAILKLGAQFEGVIRECVIMRDGFHRSTAMYSILSREWLDIRRRLESRLAA